MSKRSGLSDVSGVTPRILTVNLDGFSGILNPDLGRVFLRQDELEWQVRERTSMHSTDGKSDTASACDGDSGRTLTNGGTVCGVARHSREGPGISGTNNECAGCGKRITDRFLLKALDMYWHEDCLKCGCCDCRLGEVGSTLYTKANLILCKRDYLRLFGNTGYCAACSKVIPAFEMVMRARNNVYHLECFACQQCNHRFCVGDRFYLCENKILCEYDYEERMVFANMAYSPGNLALLRRQVTHFQQPGVQNEQQREHFPLSQTPVTRHFNDSPPSRGPENTNVMKSSKGAGQNSNFLMHPCPTKGPGCSNFRQVTSTNTDDGSNGYGSPDSGLG